MPLDLPIIPQGLLASSKCPSSNLPEFLSHAFDYIIIGGGTAGLVLAARLSEDPDVRVGVIEAGKSRIGDMNVESPAQLANTLSNPEYDWTYHSTPQAGTNGKVHHVACGKLLGGSSGINFMAYVRPAAEDIDLWERLGNKGWSWAELLPYYRKSETVEQAKSQEGSQHPDLYNSAEECHGHSGPIKTSFPRERSHLEDVVIGAFDEAWGIPRPKDPWAGKPLGLYGHLSTVDTDRGATRSYATSAFLQPHIDRGNLKVLTESTVCKLLIEDSIARGVEFSCGGSTHQVFANVEVILSAGSVQSPYLLELSGIGDPKVLLAAGIDCVLPLPAVGNNLRDHPMTSITYAFDKDQLGKQGPSGGGVSVMAFLPYRTLVSPSELEQTVSPVKECNHLSELERQSIAARLESLQVGTVQFNGNPAYMDIGIGHTNQSKLHPDTTGHNKVYYGFIVTITSPLSRGSTHVVSSNPFVAPNIDLGLLSDPIDVALLAAGVDSANEVFSSRHFSGQKLNRVIPSPEIDLKDREQRSQFVRDRTTSFNHMLGTCAMGSVVDERLKVHGIRGLRVVDASVMPTQISGNVMATVYAIAEKAADMVKEDHRQN